MGMRAPWQDCYLICQSSSISEAKDFSSGIGVESGKFILPLTNRPNLGYGHTEVVTEKATGVSLKAYQTYYEYHKGVILPTVTLEMEYTPHLASLFMWLLFQNGVVEEGAPTYTKTSTYWTSCVPEIYCNIVRVMSGSVADSFRIRGAICKSLSISSEKGSAWKLAAEMVGAYLDTDFNASTAVLAYSERNTLVFSDIDYVYFNGDQSGDRVYRLESFNLTITNNVIPKYYNSQNPVSFVLGRLDGSLDFKLSWADTAGGGMEFLNLIKTFADVTMNIQVTKETFMTDVYLQGIPKDFDIVSEAEALVSGKILWGNSVAGLGITDRQARGIT